MSVIDIVRNIFKNDIKPPFTYKLSLNESLDTFEKINKYLSDILLIGLTELYGDGNNGLNITKIAELSKEEVDDLKNYMKSMGYTFDYIFRYNRIRGEVRYKLTFKPYVEFTPCKKIN